MKIDAKLIGVFVGGVVIGLVSMYFAYERFFLSPNAPCRSKAASEEFEVNLASCKELQEWKDLEDEKKKYKDERNELQRELEGKTKELKKTSRERWGVIGGLGGLGLVVALSLLYKKKKGGKLEGAKDFKVGFYKK